MTKQASTHYPIHALLQNRWSPRAFSSQPIAKDALLSLFEAARWAPSSGNLQPWAFLVVEREDGDVFDGFVSLLNDRNALWAQNAPVLVLTVAKVERQPGQVNFWAMYDLGQAVAHLTMQASAQGISLRQMGGFDREKARAFFEIPAGYEPVSAIAVGYQGSPEGLPDDMRGRELEPRSRKPLADFVFDGIWDRPVEEASESPLKVG